MPPLVPAVPDSERLAFCLFLALVFHGMGILGVAFSSSPPGARPDLEVFWEGGTGWPGSVAEIGEGPPWPSSPQSAPASTRGLDGRVPEAYTLEQEYVRQWVARTEHLGNNMVQGLNGEVVVHVVMDAQGGVRQVEVEPGPESLAYAARRIVMQSQPHAPFSEGLRAHRDQLQISRRWLFGKSAGLHLPETFHP
ncbi:MAG: hypothetical protein OXC38_06120 [Gammaproteobacteria bacterium]|nr:hypothetical protein [Gammaproteobacteria bacterium]